MQSKSVAAVDLSYKFVSSFKDDSMTLYEFNSLLENEKISLVWSEGEYIADREDDNHKILLYQLQAFYVEVFYNRIENAVMKSRSFCNINQLESYLTNIQIPPIKGVIY